MENNNAGKNNDVKKNTKTANTESIGTLPHVSKSWFCYKLLTLSIAMLDPSGWHFSLWCGKTIHDVNSGKHKKELAIGTVARNLLVRPTIKELAEVLLEV
ncbi:MAG: hypothetical protein ACI88H_000668 [Cocleimonas sp.]|jgi:hypothetical protein